LSAPSQFALLKERRFLPFFLTQFLGAGNDNVFKYAFTLLVTYRAHEFSRLETAQSVQLIAALFVLPFLLFSATSGQLADKFEKAGLMRLVKTLEVAIMLLAAVGFYLQSFIILCTCTLLMGLHSTLFGPVKYSYLPERLQAAEIIGGNALVEMGTFVAILLGSITAGALIDSGPNGHLVSAGVCVALALAGLVASMAIPAGTAAAPQLAIDWNPVRVTLENLNVARRERAVFLSLLGISWLWFFGAVFLTQFPQFAKETLGGNPAVATLLLAVFSVGIGVGSLLCERLSRHQIEIGLVPFGSLGMSAFTIDLFFAVQGLPIAGDQTISQFVAHGAHWRVLADLYLLALFAGLYSVPLYALIQTRCEPSHRARIIAANNILNALFLILAAGLSAWALSALGWTIAQLFLATAIVNVLVAGYIYSLVPEFLLRFLSWLLVHSIYRIRTCGASNIPDRGAALIVCNHVSYVDALLLMAASPRPIRFVMDVSIFRVPVLSWLFRQVRAIPIAPARVDAALKQRAFEQVSEALRDGQLVCIFPEGRITDTGELYPFRPGLTRVLQADPVPVIPVALQGLWGSLFSRAGAAPWPILIIQRIFGPLGIQVGAALDPAEATPMRLQEQVAALRGNWR